MAARPLRPRLRPRLAMAVAGLLACAGLLWMPAASAEDPGTLDVTKSVAGWTDGHEVVPGEAFVYTITITCSNLGSGGCTNAVLTDPLPTGVLLDPDGTVSVVGAGATVDTTGGVVTVTFTDPLADPPGSVGMVDGSSATVQVPVVVDPDIPASQSGQDLTNVAVADGTNTEPDDGRFTVVPLVEVDLAATAAKQFDPASGVAVPGTGTVLTLTGGNASNADVDTVTLTDPVDPTASPNPFDHLAMTGPPTVGLPPGAEEVGVEVFVSGAWQQVYSGAPPVTYPPGVDPSAVRGVRVTFTSTDGDGIAPGDAGSVSFDLVQRDDIADAVGTIDNGVAVTVSAGGASSDPAAAQAAYTVLSADLPLEVTKSFDPTSIAVGEESVVHLGATNTSDRTLDHLTLVEPGADPNPFLGGLTFSGWGSPVVWPAGATRVEVTFSLADGSSPTLASDVPDTLPDPPAGSTVIGVTLDFTGEITPGAEAAVPFLVTADPEQGPAELEHPNQVTGTSTAPGGFSGEDTDSDVLTTIERRISVSTGKRIEPDAVYSVPGQVVTVLLTGRLDPFPASTTEADEIVVQDPADLATDEWYDHFRPTAVAETPIPAGATLTVQWWDGTQWQDVPGMVDLPGPQIFTADLPADVVEDAQGIRFVYRSDDGFPPGTEVSPNLSFEVRPEAAGSIDEVSDCAAASATSSTAAPASATTADCPTVQLVPPTPGTADFIDKVWDLPRLVGERTGEEIGASVRWSTSGASRFPRVRITDEPDPSESSLPSSVFDTFDLVRIDPIQPSDDPHLIYDQVASVELWSVSAGGWIDPPDDPCPAACDGTFPGYTLSPAQQQDVIAFRLTYVESPTRADRIGGDPTAPPVGTGVAPSSGNDRRVHPVFRIRDDLRSDPEVPVVAAGTFNVAGQPGQVRNTARFTVVVEGQDYVDQDASDTLTITEVPVTASLAKTWTGGPLGVPPDGTAFPDDWPTARMRLDAVNTTPRDVDRITIVEPVLGSDPFDAFNLRGFDTITGPGSIGAEGVVVTLDLSGGGTRTLTRDEALAATEAELVDVVGFRVVYDGRIEAGAHAHVVLDTRLRPTHRSDDSPVEAGETITNLARTTIEDLVDYPGTPPVVSTDSDSASIDLFPVGIGVEATKSFDPSEQTEPDRSPLTMTLSARPSGPSRTNQMVLTDVDASFWNQYDLVGLGSAFVLAPPIDRVRIDVLTGGTFVAAGGDVVLQGATWVEGETGATPALPAGVVPGEVQGLRLTFTRSDGGLWENPADPLQEVPLTVQRRETLRSGGEVPSDLLGNPPAPGEDTAGEATNSFSADVSGADLVGGEPISASDETVATVRYVHATTAVEVTKTPSGARPPGAPIPYTLTFTNTGDLAVLDPVITDRLPTDATGPLLVLDPSTEDHYTFALDGAAPTPSNGPALPTDPAQVTVVQTPTLLTFSFPPGSVLEVGQTYTVTVALVFRDGLPGSTEVTNTTGISGDRPWDECEGVLDPDSGECRASTTVNPTRAGAIRGTKTVRAVDDELGVADTRDTGCTPDADGFFSGGCVPLTKPGGEEVWRLRFDNSGNLPLDRIVAVDRLPAVGDTGVVVDQPRDSEFRPLPRSVTYAGSRLGTASEVRVYVDLDDDVCGDDLTATGCPPGAWTLVSSTTLPPNGWTADLPADARAVKVEIDYDGEMLQPTGDTIVDVRTTTPAQGPARTADPIAWNTVAQAGRTNDGGVLALAPRAEGNKVGVALATGPLRVRKVVTGPAADHAPSVFPLEVSCTSAGEEVDLGPDASPVLVPPATVLVEDLPWGSVCTVSEGADAVGATHVELGTATVGRGAPAAVLVATNVYADASLVIAKEVSGSAVDADGDPVGYGPFTFDVTCTFLDEPVQAEGYGPDQPMRVSFRSGERAVLEHLPAGAECRAVETSTAGASGTTSTATTTTGRTTGTTTIDLVLTEDASDGTATNTVTFDNTFETAGLRLVKVVDGPGAALFGAGPFTLHVGCTAPDGRVVWDGDVVLGGDRPLEHTVEDLYAGAVCEVTETGTGGATVSSISPDTPVLAVAGATVSVTATNTFEVGAVRVVKQLTGDGAADVPRDQRFRVRLACTREVDGEAVPVPVRDDGTRTVSRDSGLVVTYDALPVGATCRVSEPDAGGADRTSIEPGRVVVADDVASSVEVVVTNEFDADDPDEVAPAEDVDDDQPETVGPTADTGGRVAPDRDPLGLAALLAALLSVACGTALLLLRRRAR